MLTQSAGSALVELGHTKVLCAVHGPRTASSSFGKTEFHSEGSLNCEFRYAPEFGASQRDGASSAFLSNEEVELSARVRDAIVASIPLEKLSKCVLDVYVMVLQADGAVLSAAITAASLALADAGVELYDLVPCCSAAVVKNADGSFLCLTDPTEEETSAAVGIVTLAMLPNWKEVTFWDQTGRLPTSIALNAMELCRDGCFTIHKFMRHCLVRTDANP